MKANIRRGSSFRGLLNYALDRGDACGIVGGNLDGRAPKALSEEFAVVRRIRPDCKRPVWHCSLSLPAGEHLDEDRWSIVADSLMTKIGMNPSRHPFTVVIHRDTPHEHVHIIASRISLDGELWHGVDEALTAQQATQELEIEHGLTITKGPDTDEKKHGRVLKAKLKLSQAEQEMWIAREIAPPKLTIASAIDQTISLSDGTPEDFQRHLEQTGIEARLSIGRGKITGGSYSMVVSWSQDGNVLQELCAYKGGDIGRLYEAKEIETRLAARRAEMERRDRVASLKAERAIELHHGDTRKLAVLTASLKETGIYVEREFTRLRHGAVGDARTSTHSNASSRRSGHPQEIRSRSRESDQPAQSMGFPDSGDPRRSAKTSGSHRTQGRGRSVENRPYPGRNGNHHQPAENPVGGPGPAVLASAQTLPGTGHRNTNTASWKLSDSVSDTSKRSADDTIQPTKPRQAFKVTLLSRRYRHALDIEGLTGHLHWIRPGLPGGPIQVALYGGQRIVDDGKAISLTRGQADDIAVRTMLRMAEANGWQSVTVKGSDEFKARAWLEAQRRGIIISGYDPPERVRAMWAAISKTRKDKQDGRNAHRVVASDRRSRTRPHRVDDSELPNGPKFMHGIDKQMPEGHEVGIDEDSQSSSAGFVPRFRI